MARLGLDDLDLYLIHQPHAIEFCSFLASKRLHIDHLLAEIDVGETTAPSGIRATDALAWAREIFCRNAGDLAHLQQGSNRQA
jgi:hypothetical protein